MWPFSIFYFLADPFPEQAVFSVRVAEYPKGIMSLLCGRCRNVTGA